MSNPIKAFAAVIALIVGAFAVVAAAGAAVLQHARRDYLNRADAIRVQEAAYRRPLPAEPAIEGNAAVWYRQAFSHFRTASMPRLNAIRDGGAESFDATASREASAMCAEVRSARVDRALHSTQCDWDLRIGYASIDGHGFTVEPIELADCLLIEGHRAASEGNGRAAAHYYLDSVALAADLGPGDVTMALSGTGIASWSFVAIAKLVGTLNDRAVLTDLRDGLRSFDRATPDTRLAFERERLWFVDLISLRQAGSASSILSLRSTVAQSRAALNLWRYRRIAETLSTLASTSDRGASLQMAEDLKRYDSSSDELTSGMRLSRDAYIRASSIELGAMQRATVAATTLRIWFLDHGSYPGALADAGISLAPWIRYELAPNRMTYRLVGPRGPLFESTGR